MDDLIRELTGKLGVNRRQAQGGLVAILRTGRQNLSAPDFAEFVRDVPGAEKLLRNAPPPSALSSLAGGLGSLLGGRSSTAGRWAGLAASFAELGVDLDTAKKFGPIVMEHVRRHGGDELLDKLKDALKL
jgi:Protein of unknown function VcgC/VcgE (DUF2780)